MSQSGDKLSSGFEHMKDCIIYSRRKQSGDDPMNTRSIVIIAIFAVVAVVGARIILDPPSGTAYADEVKNEMTTGQIFSAGDITIANVRARETVPGASVGGGYMVITNNGSEDDRLMGGKTSVSPLLEVHEMKMENDVMKMRQLNDGLVIKAGQTVMLQPGGFHIMFMDLEAPLTKNTSFDATLNFEKSGSVRVKFNVVDMKMLKMAH
jgi:copper(I)-binding protein